MKYLYILIGLLMLWAGEAVAQIKTVNPDTDRQLLEQFHDAKLGLFVHWMACHSPGMGDSWAIGRAKTKAQADSITMRWNPEKFDPREIVDVAVKGGCKYMVVISKHHDGFCLWPSDYSVFDIERIGFRRDILKELGDECRCRGLLFGIYYSIADIDYCGWPSMPEAGKPVREPKYGKEDFVQFVHNQTRELVTRYQPDILWFDGHWLDPVWGPEEARGLYRYVKSLKPNTLSTRLSVTKGADGQETFWTDGASGDYFSMEAKTTEGPDFPWEACTSITYPVYAYEPDAPMMSRKDLQVMFSKTLCGNGNLLVNIGPKPDGSMPAEQVARLREFAAWVDGSREAVYGTNGGPYRQTEVAGSTYAGNKVYLHLRSLPGELAVKALDGYRLKRVRLLATGRELPFEEKNGTWRLDLANLEATDDIVVLVMELDKPYRFTDWIPLQD